VARAQQYSIFTTGGADHRRPFGALVRDELRGALGVVSVVADLAEALAPATQHRPAGQPA